MYVHVRAGITLLGEADWAGPELRKGRVGGCACMWRVGLSSRVEEFLGLDRLDRWGSGRDNISGYMFEGAGEEDGVQWCRKIGEKGWIFYII